MRTAIEDLPQRWDFVLLDCTPTLGHLSVSALMAAAWVVIHVEASIMAYQAVLDILETIGRLRRRLNPALQVLGVLAVRTDSTRHTRDVVEALRQQFGEGLPDHDPYYSAYAGCGQVPTANYTL